jgi:hypothetical protein
MSEAISISARLFFLAAARRRQPRQSEPSASKHPIGDAGSILKGRSFDRRWRASAWRENPRRAEGAGEAVAATAATPLA